MIWIIYPPTNHPPKYDAKWMNVCDFVARRRRLVPSLFYYIYSEWWCLNSLHVVFWAHTPYTYVHIASNRRRKLPEKWEKDGGYSEKRKQQQQISPLIKVWPLVRSQFEFSHLHIGVCLCCGGEAVHAKSTKCVSAPQFSSYNLVFLLRPYKCPDLLSHPHPHIRPLIYSVIFI